MRGWRIAAILSAAVLGAQLFRLSALIDVISGQPPAQVHLVFPFFHAVFAPFTLLADYLNGGSTADLKAFGAWALVVYVLARLRSPKGVRRELTAALVFGACVGLFLWWGVRWERPIPRLVADDTALIIFDTHSHTAASHDGRKGFGDEQNAQWHLRAGFDAAFITDHNVFGAARQWQVSRAGRPPHLLDGVELSLSGLHMVVLGNDSPIGNKPWDASFDSSLALLSALHRSAAPPYVIASLPEYNQGHWGADLGRIIAAGTEGLEIWTTSPRAMDFPRTRRREVIARAKSLGVALFGATDMHGLGYAATVWNVTALPGWRALSDSALTQALISRFRSHPGDLHVIARRRVIGEAPLERVFAFPHGLLNVVRSVPMPQVLALLVWCWIPVLFRARRGSPTP